ncbi:hypothetical protein CSA56_01400 [candidate division KSB3 bacterium]|uniref:Phage shock protein A n=1 Tax=candidate division KSB3 bacterium TaxID=2044937 RepID=A0A2G6KKB3_9BACT|nr:MAG: hypothetical protein CSA56_01400 [candidate division KSB3 bacterium]
MNLFTRLWNALKAQINALINRMENPERALDQSIRTMQKQVDRLRGDVVKIIAEEKKLKNQVETYQKDVGRWENNAMLALKEGNEALAREALRRKREAVEFTQQLQPQWQKQQQIAERLKQDFRELRERIQTAQKKKQMLVTRLRRAETQKRLQGMLNELSENQVFEKFESKLLDTEAMNAAQEEMQKDALDTTLEEQFEALERSNEPDIDRELEALKKHMELNP